MGFGQEETVLLDARRLLNIQLGEWVLPHLLWLFTVYQALGDKENYFHFKDKETEAQRARMISLRSQASYACLASDSSGYLVVWALQGVENEWLWAAFPPHFRTYHRDLAQQGSNANYHLKIICSTHSHPGSGLSGKPAGSVPLLLAFLPLCLLHPHLLDPT